MIYSKKQRDIKKESAARKCFNLLRTSKCVLFFHYNGAAAPKGSTTCKSWQQMKEQIPFPHLNTSLLVPSKISHHSLIRSLFKDFKDAELCLNDKSTFSQAASPFEVYRLLTVGGALLVGCSSAQQMITVLQKCSSPTFFAMGGLYDMRAINHLDLKRWAALEGYQAGPSLPLGSKEATMEYLETSIKSWRFHLNLGQNIFNPFLSQQLFLLKQLKGGQGSNLHFLSHRLFLILGEKLVTQLRTLAMIRASKK